MGILAVAGVTGCAFEPVTWVTPTADPSPTGPVDQAEELDPQVVIVSVDGSPKTIIEGSVIGRRLSTPQFDCWFEGAHVGERLSSETVAQVRLEREIKAPAGYEIATFAIRAGRPWHVEGTETEVTFQLRLGDRVLDLQPPLGKFTSAADRYEVDWVMYVVCVEEGRDVIFDVTDQGKTCSMDIRVGLPVENADWAANQAFRERLEVTVDPPEATFRRNVVTLPPADLEEPIEPEQSEFSLVLNPGDSTSIMPWMPELGWAPDGQLWLLMETRALVQFPPESPRFVLDMVVASSFLYQDETGADLAAVHPERINSEELRLGQVDLNPVWLVSATDARAVVRCNPDGAWVTNYIGGLTIPAQFVDRATALEFALTIAPEGAAEAEPSEEPEDQPSAAPETEATEEPES